MDGKITYHQQVSYCGKPRCRRCREGTGHGPYWYAYQIVDGRTVRTYIGKQLPAELQNAVGKEQEAPSPTPGLAGAALRLYTLGQFRLERKDDHSWHPVTEAAMQHQRVRALLACLISSPGRKIGREQALEMLWPDLDFETASSRLDRAVHSLRQLFDPGRSKPATSDILLTQHQTLLLASQEQLWVDADAFEALYSQAHTTDDLGQREQLLEDAMKLYGGAFLPEAQYVEWTQARREALHRSWIGLLLELADLRIERDAITGAIDTLDRLLGTDPTNEAAVQRLMLLLSQLGRRAEALRIYQRFAAMLKQQYKIAPLPETRSFYETIQKGGELPARNAQDEQRRNEPPATPGTPPQEQTPSSLQVGRSNQSPLVGRERELDSLRQTLLEIEQAARFKLPGQKKAGPALDARSRPQCILLMGDVGIGKTRLAEEIGREARKHGWVIAWSRAYAQESSIPYRLWTEVVRKSMTHGLWQRQEVSNHPLLYQPLKTLLPELNDLLPHIEPAGLSPEQEQLRLWDAACSLLELIGENTPLLIVLDDLQWADGSSCELLGYLARQFRGHPIMIVGTCRDIELPTTHPLRTVLIDLQREQAVETQNIRPLTDEQIRSLISYIPEKLAQHIQERAAGNPFFAEELARGIDSGGESGALPPEPDTDLPDTISAVLDLRLGRISSACQRLLVRAAVLGGSFEFPSLFEMQRDSSGTPPDEDDLLDLLEEALRAGMLAEEGNGTRITYHFWHPLLVSHLYESLSAARRASLHRRAGYVLRQAYLGREEEGAAAIAFHLERGGAESDQIARYAEIAGDHAYALSAFPEAERHYRLALEHLNVGSQFIANPDGQLHEAYLRERLGECAMIQGHFEEARHCYEQALDIHSKQQTFASQAEEQHEAQLRALFWREIGLTWRYMGDNEQAQGCRERGEQVLRQAGVTSGPAWASLRYHYSSICWSEGNYEAAIAAAREALGMFEETLQGDSSVSSTAQATRLQRTLAGDPVDLGRMHMLLGSILAAAGQAANALDHLNAALAVFEQYDRQREIANVCCNLGDIYLKKAQHEQARAMFRRSLSISERIGDTPSISVCVGNLGVLAAHLGDLAESESWYRRGLAFAEQVNDPVYISVMNIYLAATMQDRGNFPEAVQSLVHAIETSRATQIDPCLGFALVILGELRIAQASASEDTTQRRRLLNRAGAALRHALNIEGLEAEARTEGLLVQAQISLLLGNIYIARQQAAQALTEAQRYELAWLAARTRRLLGSILAISGGRDEWQEAEEYFTLALQLFHDSGMRLEEARTLQSYGSALLQRSGDNEEGRRQGLHYLQEARQIFHERKAIPDLQAAEYLLSAHTPQTRTAARTGDTRKRGS